MNPPDATLPWVLLPGWGMTATMMQPLAAALAPHRVICLDWPRDAGLWQQAVDGNPAPLLVTLLEACPEPAIWLGWSLGGLLLGRLLQAPALSSPVRAAVSLGMGPSFVQQPPCMTGLPPAELRSFNRAFRRNASEAWAHFVQWQLQGDGATATDLNGLQQQACGPDAFELPVLQAGLVLLQQLNNPTLLQASPCPLLFLRGENDPLCPAWGSLPEQAIHAQLTWQELPDAGHLPWLHKAAETAALLQAWRQGVAP